MGTRILGIVIVLLGVTSLSAQSLNLKAQEDFLDIVEPIITKGEREVFEGLADFRARKYFQEIFWYKRNPEPKTTGNPYRRIFFDRRNLAKAQFEEGNTSGENTDRGMVYQLLGDPDDVVQNKLAESGLKPGFEEIWRYDQYDLSLRFIYDGLRPTYRLQDAARHEMVFERIRNLSVLDRAEPYRLNPRQLTLPNLGFTKDVENLVAEDKFEIDFEVSYAFLRGGLNRVELLVSLTFKDASNKGMTINLTAYDPYDNKVEDFKKRVQPVNGRPEIFSLVIEPDQYQMVLRLTDKDGRAAISRRRLDVPNIDPKKQGASSLMAASEMMVIPLEGFDQPKKFVFADRFFAIRNDFSNFRGDRLYLMQHYYNFADEPQVSWYRNHQLMKPEVVAKVEDAYGTRMVVSFPVDDLPAGGHHFKSVYRNEAGDLQVTPYRFVKGAVEQTQDVLITRATDPGDKVRLIQPSRPGAEFLDRVFVSPAEGVTIQRLYVYLNDRLLFEQDQAPFEVRVPEGVFSISGENRIVVLVQTDKGLFKLEKELEPLRADENIQTRVVEIFFNAFTEDLNFISDLDLGTLQVEVDGETVKPKDMRKLEEPITYCFMVDTSFSMKESFEGNLGALRKFIQSMRPDDSGYVIGFDNRYQQYMEPNASKDVLLAVIQALELQRPNPKLGDRLYQENETFLYDSVIAGIHTLHQYPGRKVIVLVTDGIGTEGLFRRNAMLSYARENDVVIYSLWLDNNPKLSEDEFAFLQKEQTKAEKVARAIGLSRLFAKKDTKANYIGQKIRKSAINQGIVQLVAEESGGFHYRIFKADRSLIRDYVTDIESAIQNQYVLSLDLPLSLKIQEVDIFSSDPDIAIRNKTHVKVRKSNPLAD